MVYEYFIGKNLFKRHKYSSPKTSNMEYFRTLSLHYEGFHMSLNYPYTNAKKMVCLSGCGTVQALIGKGRSKIF